MRDYFSTPYFRFLVCVFLSIYTIVFTNSSFLKFLTNQEINHSMQVQIILFVFAFNLLIFAIVLLPVIFKILVAIILMISTIVDYFMRQYSILLDGEMLCNVFYTDISEVAELINPDLIITLIIKFAIPSLILMWMPITWIKGLVKNIMHYVISVSAAIALLCCSIAVEPKTFNFINMNSLFFKTSVVPFNFFCASGSLLGKQKVNEAFDKSSLNDVKIGSLINTAKKKVFIFVVGESVRSGNFSLNGYDKSTNPLLKDIKNLISFTDVTACATSTFQSVPCLFSSKTGTDFKIKENSVVNALDIVAKAGFKVRWYENNSESYGAAIRHEIIDLDPIKQFDGAFIDILKKEIEVSNQDLFLVFHTIGSHGPLYHKRSTEETKRFFPECNSNQFNRCSDQEIVNAYDNSIIYTDYVMASLIKLLDRDDIDAALLYIGDHGESLGEYGVYLHAFPYSIAPKEQLKVPFILWLNDSFIINNNIDFEALSRFRNWQLSHDHIFHTTLGLLGIETNFLDHKLNLTAK